MENKEITRIQKKVTKMYEEIEKLFTITDYTDKGMKIYKYLESINGTIIDILNINDTTV